jgi:2-amino-4-hydroxy-6-hydroxymethyldihydropteridine diphosphokinase
MINVFLLLGGNMGNRLQYLKQAAVEIQNSVGPIAQYSSIYETQAWGKTTEPNYLNQVLLVQTNLMPPVLLETVLQIELKLGRERNQKWDSRTMDIDVLFYGDDIITAPDLIVPHPELHKRRFTLEPLSEIAPDFIHPLLQKSIQQLKKDLDDCLVVKKL